jgi:hypothetical protein
MGPVIEQGTHFCDLSRYFGGDVEIDSVVYVPSFITYHPSEPSLPPESRRNILTTSAKSVEFYEQPGKLSKVPVDESKIPEEDRIPRITTAVWYVPVSLPDLS